ncbi:Nitrate/nitrite transporter NarK [Kytococcus aerolatus]|uniref:Nitrate/nitrite transporter NarK n=1 Tax=Kytococcus aerolatus TaxID=592308 RepID=A0A212T0S3_9MICO|nr:OFA family MFS transporter [Kytococcus aerolatus]SNC59638.1 Nitrate/nitrite transporter NarK [Kytococcus aerolatus]
MAFLGKAESVAPPGYSKWLIPPAALAVHLAIGQVYGFSVFKTSLVERFGSSQTAIAWIFSLAIVVLGLSAALFGTWVEKNGPRRAMFVATLCWVTGFVVGALGIATNQLWLLYLGYGVIGGIGLGIGYISPVSTLMKWFPDRPGLATGMAIMGFGGGALFASPLSNRLMAAYDSSFDPTTKGAVASADALWMTFLTLGAIYLFLMLVGVALMRLPQGHGSDEGAAHSPAKNGVQVRAATAIRTPQFWLLWTILFCNVTAGIGILEQAAPMIQDFFRENDGLSSVTAAAAGGFVGVLSLANMAGRFAWSTLSDSIGRKPIYTIYLGVGLAAYALLATIGQSSTVVFVGLALVILSFYGGGFATIPAYLKDLFGTLEVGAIHGRLLTAWAAAGVAGPLIINTVLDAAGEPGTMTAGDYRPALFTMVGVLAVGFIANLLVRPVAERHSDHEAARAAAQKVAENEAALRDGSMAAARGTTSPVLIVLAWACVVGPLAYGLWVTLEKASKLFIG